MKSQRPFTQHFKRPLALVTAVLFLTTGWVATSDLLRLSLEPESKLWVEGTSTIHDWTCEVGAFTGAIEATDATSIADALSQVQVSVPVAELECKNGTMNGKAHDALKAKKHGTIRYTMTDATVQSEGSDGAATLQARGTLTIAGTEKPVTLTVKGQKLDDGGYRFTGSTPLLMSDFGVKPPTAMLGTMKTGDRVVVHFDVVAR